MTHLDLFSGIGGFALAAQTVWGSDYHCVGFCEIDSFCQQTLRKNFPGVTIYGDIRGLTAERLAADTESNGRRPQWAEPARQQGEARIGDDYSVDLLTGGFPCQPFSTAGKRKGTEDDRFLWPEMFRVIRETQPRWIIGENVAGIIEMALGQVCADLAELHYEVQCFVIPACAVNAPHRRDRVWIVAHSIGTGAGGDSREAGDEGWRASEDRGTCLRQEHGTAGTSRIDAAVADAASNPSDNGCDGRVAAKRWGTQDRCERREPERNLCPGRRHPEYAFPDWSRDWREVAFGTCVRGVDDGVPGGMAGLSKGIKGGYRVVPGGEEGQVLISESKWRQSALKAYGNAIVPEVAMEIMRAIKEADVAEAEDSLACAA